VIEEHLRCASALLAKPVAVFAKSLAHLFCGRDDSRAVFAIRPLWIDAIAQFIRAERTVGIGGENLADPALELRALERPCIRRLAVALHIGALATGGGAIFFVGALRLEFVAARFADRRLCTAGPPFLPGLVIVPLVVVFDLALLLVAFLLLLLFLFPRRPAGVAVIPGDRVAAVLAWVGRS